MASAPSDPHSNCAKSKPVLSFASPDMCEMTDPSGSTASMPVTCRRVIPYASTRMPPALVATVPPMVAESRDARSTPYSSPAARACRWTSPKVVPAPTLTCADNSSTGSTHVIRRVDTMTGSSLGWSPDVSRPAGTDPPTSPVFPPWGSIGTPAAVHALAMAETSSVFAGRTTHSAGPWKRRVQSTQ